MEVGQAQHLRKYSDEGYPWQWPTWYAELRNTIEVAFVISKEGCQGGSTKTQGKTLGKKHTWEVPETSQEKKKKKKSKF